MRNLAEISIADLIPGSIANDEQVKNAIAALDGEIRAVTTDIQQAVITADIDNQPSDVLDHLAWQFDVDFYEQALPIQQKRNLIREAIYWHRIKGTPGAVQRVVDAIFGGGQIEEWFQYGGIPHRFRVRAEGSFPDAATYNRLIRLVNATKNVRSFLESVIIDTRLENELYYAAVVHQGGRIDMGPRPAVTEVGQTNLIIGSGFHRANQTTVTPLQFRISVNDTDMFYGGSFHESRYMAIQ